MSNIENELMNKLNTYLNASEEDPIKISKLILSQTSKEYKSSIEEKFANIQFIESVSDFCDYFTDSKVLSNLIFSVGAVCSMYDFYPDKAFLFLWRYSGDKKQIPMVSRHICSFPQFLQQDDYTEFLIKLPKIAPKINNLRVLNHILRNIINDVVDIDFLVATKEQYEKYIEKKPDSYYSTAEKSFPFTIKIIDDAIKHLQ